MRSQLNDVACGYMFRIQFVIIGKVTNDGCTYSHAIENPNYKITQPLSSDHHLSLHSNNIQTYKHDVYLTRLTYILVV